MARYRNRNSGVAEFFQGFNEGYNTVGRVLQDKAMRDVATAQEEDATAFTQDQAGQIEAAAQSGQYNVGFDADKNAYTITPKEGGETGVVAPTRSVKFLGKSYDQPLTEQQKDRARMTSMADVFGKFGKPEDAIRMRQQITQSEQMEKQGKLTDLQIEEANRRNDSANKLKEADAEVASFIKNRVKFDESGQPMQMSDDDFVMAGKQRVFSLANRGLFNEAQQAGREAMDFAAKKIQAETNERAVAVRDAVARAMNGDYAQAMAVYNKFIPDGSTATGVKVNKDGTITMDRTSAVDGTKLAPAKFESVDQMLSTLQSMADPNAATQYIERTFRHDIETRRMKADEKRLDLEGERVNLEGERVNIARGESKRANEKWGVEKGMLEDQANDSKELRAVRKGLGDALNSGDPAKIEAAKQKAAAYGIKFEKPNNEYNYVPNPLGGGVIVNKDTGSAAMYNQEGIKTADITAPGAGAQGRKVGTEQVIQSGPNKGKTAVWDGNGWTLKQ